MLANHPSNDSTIHDGILNIKKAQNPVIIDLVLSMVIETITWTIVGPGKA